MTRGGELYNCLESPAQAILARFSGMTPIQELAIPLLIAKQPVLIVAPTASGKTEAAIAPMVHLWARERWHGKPSILYIAPTRALVNDVYRRLSMATSGHLTIGRRTAEHQNCQNEILITTPESLDSMLARWQPRPDGLRNVRAVVLDELHLLAENARGTQLAILLARLDRAARAPVVRVGLSATVTNADRLARRFLNDDARVVSVGGGRQMTVHRLSGAGEIEPRPAEGIDPLASDLFRADGVEDTARAFSSRLLEARATAPLKALVFVPTRARCDKLTEGLRRELKGSCPAPVLGHHGSLSRGERERTESTLVQAPESVAVATTTLELGIDIGDINLVVLDGPPGSVSSLLQRAGRANRRESTVHLMPFANNTLEACTTASMIRASMAGTLDPEPATMHLSVGLQQAASVLKQSARSRVMAEELTRLFSREFAGAAESVVDGLTACGFLEPHDGGVLGASDGLREIIDSPLRLHSNIGNGLGVPVVDAVTGDTVAWVPRQHAPKIVSIAGACFAAEVTPEAIQIRNAKPTQRSGTFRYGVRKAPVLRSALRHLCLGLGLSDSALVHDQGRWLHFGGAIFARLLTCAGISSTPLYSNSDPRTVAGVELETLVDRSWQSLEPLLGFGPFHRMLPDELRKAAVLASTPVAAFRDWVGSLEVVTLSAEQRSVLGG